MADPKRHLLRRWLHSHEEDTATERVYRPADYAFPPSRGRTGFELKPGGEAVRVGIAARDGSAERNGTWSLEKGPEPTLTVEAGGQSEQLRIVSVDDDRLVVRK